MAGFNAQAVSTSLKLADAFGLQVDPASLAIEDNPDPQALSFGIEVEVPWSSYFPTLWKQFGLDRRRVCDLDPGELTSLSCQCANLEAELRPLLNRTVACGVPRGNDRYWEFSLRPVHDVDLLLEQVRLLGAAGVLPRDRGHSLHVTIGGLPRIPAVYYLAMVLEAHFVAPGRIESGVIQSLSRIHTGWARKGHAGILEKRSSELEGAAQVAVELRMLQLPQTQEAFGELLHAVQWGARAIDQWVRRSRGETHDEGMAAAWACFQHDAKRVLAENGLPDRLWSTGRNTDTQLSLWLRFCEALPAIKASLQLPHLGHAEQSPELLHLRLRQS